MRSFLIVGKCGVGKTWVLRQLLEQGDYSTHKIGKVKFALIGRVAVPGVYDGSTFEGSDRLSRSVATDFTKFRDVLKQRKLKAVFEGDRFMNRRCLRIFRPEILKIKGDGAKGRERRNSDQSEEHLQRIATRVDRMKAHREFEDSGSCLEYLKENL